MRRRALMGGKHGEPYVVTRGLNGWADYAIDAVYNAGLAKSNEGLTAKECASYTGDLVKSINGTKFLVNTDLSWVQYFNNIKKLKLNNINTATNEYLSQCYLIYIYPNSNVQYQTYFYYGSMSSSPITADIIVPKRTPLSNMFSNYDNGKNKHIYVPDDAVDAYKTISRVQNIHPFSDAPASLMAKLKVPIGD